MNRLFGDGVLRVRTELLPANPLFRSVRYCWTIFWVDDTLRNAIRKPFVHGQAVVVEDDAAGIDSRAFRRQHKDVRWCEFHDLAKLMLALAKLFFAAAQIFIEMAKSSGSFVEYSAELREFVFAVDRDCVIELAARERFRTFHQPPQRIGDAFRNHYTEQDRKQQRHKNAQRDDPHQSLLRVCD